MRILLGVMKWAVIALGVAVGLALAAYLTTVASTRRAVYFHYGS